MPRRTRIDNVLQAVGLGVTLLRVLRGEKPAEVVAETTAMTERAQRLALELERYATGEDPKSAGPRA